MLAFAPLTATAGQPVAIALSPVGNPGNAADTTGYGAVPYAYDIGTYDVTLSQYCSFLNSVATTADPYGLFNTSLSTDGNVEGITRASVSGGFTYSVIGTSGSDPVTYVSWLDAARFCNWIQNGELTTGTENALTTEQGAYTLNGDIDSTGTTGIETKNAAAVYWIPSENEWYKAAYYNPTLNSGSGGYTLYATQSNTAPGNVINGPANEANYYNGVYSVTQNSTLYTGTNYLTPVGTFTNSASFYNTYDQNGDVFQWNDAVIAQKYRGFRGGGWIDPLNDMQSTTRIFDSPTAAYDDVGFRIASIPEPNSLALLFSGAAFAAAAFRRKPRAR